MRLLIAALMISRAEALRGLWSRLRAKPAAITTVVLDADGTTLNPAHEMTAGVASAIDEARAAGLQVVIATGRARGGPWVEDVLEPMQLRTPGVFLQGLVAYDADDRLIYDDTLDPLAVEAVAAACAGDASVTVCAYCRERLISPRLDARTERYNAYDDAQCRPPSAWLSPGAPAAAPWAVEEAIVAAAAEEEAIAGVSKLLVLASSADAVPALRSRLEEALRFRPARVVRALDWTLLITLDCIVITP